MVHSRNPKIKCHAKAKHTQSESEKDAHTYIHRAQVINGNTCLCFNTMYARTTKAANVYRKSSRLFCFAFSHTHRLIATKPLSFLFSVFLPVLQKYSHLTQHTNSIGSIHWTALCFPLLYIDGCKQIKKRTINAKTKGTIKKLMALL